MDRRLALAAGLGPRVRLAACVALAALCLSCSLPSRDPPTAPARIPWSDYSPFVRGLVDPFEIVEHPALRAAPIYHLSLRIAEDLSSLDGRMEVRYTNAGRRALGSLDFVLLPNIARGSMTVGDLRVDGLPAESEARRDGVVLRVRLPHPLAPDARSTVAMSYRLRIPTTPVVGFGGLLSWRGQLSLAYLYPMIPISGRWDWGSPPAWGDLTANPVSFYLVEVTYPKGLALAAPGVILSRSSTAGRARALIAFGPARDLFLALGRDLELATLRRGTTLIRSYAPGGLASASPAILEEASRALSLFERLYGPYPYRSLTFVGALFDAEGLEFPGMVLLTSWLYHDPSRSLDGSTVGAALELTVAHETAHQWFYALVGNNQLTEPWIDESMAQYSMWRYWGELHGAERAERLARSFAWDAAQGSEGLLLGRPVSGYGPRAYEATIYGRGPLFIMALARALGEDPFDRFVRELVDRERWRVVTGDELERAAERACGCDLEPLWQRWIGLTTAPRRVSGNAPVGAP